MNINETYKSLRSVHIEWKNFLLNNLYMRSDNEILWSNYNYEKIDYPIRYVDFLKMEENSQYSFQTSDGSILQLYYKYNQYGNLTNANLAYYNNISEEYGCDDNPSIPWVRIDYSSIEGRGPLHHDCHLHFCLFNNARIPLSSVPTPFQFIEFIIALSYPEHYKEKRLGTNGEYNDYDRLLKINESSFPHIECKYYSVFPHLSINKI